MIKVTKMRKYIFLFFLVLLILNIVALMAVPPSIWSLMEWSESCLYVLPVLTNVCLVLATYWIYEDEESFDFLNRQIVQLKERIKQLEADS